MVLLFTIFEMFHFEHQLQESFAKRVAISNLTMPILERSETIIIIIKYITTASFHRPLIPLLTY
jgi:hypothetical protein